MSATRRYVGDEYLIDLIRRHPSNERVSLITGHSRAVVRRLRERLKR